MRDYASVAPRDDRRDGLVATRDRRGGAGVRAEAVAVRSRATEDEIPAITGDAGEIIGYLDRRCSEGADAVRHRRRAEEEAHA